MKLDVCEDYTATQYSIVSEENDEAYKEYYTEYLIEGTISAMESSGKDVSEFTSEEAMLAYIDEVYIESFRRTVEENVDYIITEQMAILCENEAVYEMPWESDNGKIYFDRGSSDEAIGELVNGELHLNNGLILAK